MEEEKVIVDEVVEEDVSSQEGNSQEVESEKKYTDEDVDRIVNKKFARWQAKAEQELQDKLDEAEKLRKMNADQKAQYEAEKKDARIKELEAQLNRTGLEREASSMLAEHEIIADERVLSYVVRDSAEETQIAISDFVDLVNDLADKKMQKALVGKTPRKMAPQTAGPVKKLSEMTYIEKAELLNDRPDKYYQLLEEEK